MPKLQNRAARIVTNSGYEIPRGPLEEMLWDSKKALPPHLCVLPNAMWYFVLACSQDVPDFSQVVLNRLLLTFRRLFALSLFLACS